jgi:allantoinase
MPDAAIKSGRVITPHGVINATVLIKDGKIADVSESIPKGNFPVTDVDNAILMPGIVDPHVHINEPGRTEWEGFDTCNQGGDRRWYHYVSGYAPKLISRDNYR